MNDLSSLLNELVQQTGGAAAPSAVALPQAANQMKLQLKQQMNGLANTQTGIDILKQIVNNASVDIVERTAAAEVLNPGTVVNFNPDGGVSFDSPQSKVAYNPTSTISNSAGMDEAKKVEQQVATNKKVATVPELMAQVNAGLAQVNTEKDPTLIVSGLANLNQSIADFQAARTAQLRDESRRMFGIDAFEAQMEVDKRLDMQESQEVFGVDYMGMSEASQATLAQLQMAQGKANEWYQTQLATDPSLAAITSKAKYLETFANERLKTLGQSAEVSSIENLVDSTSIDAVLVAIGRDPVGATPDERRQISLQLQSNNTYFTRAQELGLRDNQVPIFLSNGGSEAEMAKNVLTYKAGGNKALVDEMINAFNNFETFTGFTPEQMEAQGLSPSTKLDEQSILGNTKEAREQREAATKMARWNFVRQQYNKQATSNMLMMNGLEDPQANNLQDFVSVRNSLASMHAADPKSPPPSLPQVIERMSWPTDKLEAQKKEEALVDYLYNQAQKAGNGVIGLPDQFGNRALIQSFVQTNRINSIYRERSLIDWAANSSLGVAFAGLTAFGKLDNDTSRAVLGNKALDEVKAIQETSYGIRK